MLVLEVYISWVCIMRSHGNYDCEIEDKTLCIKLYGATNVQLLDEVLNHVKTQVVQSDLTEFAVMVDLSEWDLSEFGSETAFEKYRPWFIEHGQRFEAIIVGGSMVKKMETLKYFLGFDSKLSIKYFASNGDARKWLEEHNMLFKK